MSKSSTNSSYRAIFDAITDAIFIHSSQSGAILDVNQGACDMYGYTPEEFLKLEIEDISSGEPPYTTQDAGRIIQQMVEQGPQTFEWHSKRKDGTLFWSEVSLQLINIDEIQQVLAVVRDITQRKQDEVERAQMQQEVIEAQQQALKELATPIIPIMDRIIVLPLIGSIDSLRARDITRTLLAGIGQYRAKIVIIDITGVSLIDSGVANHLNKTIQAARLKGARTIVTGMSDAVAETIVDLGIDWSDMTTLSDLQTGLIVALDNLGVKLSNT
jgi:PAS domain S-box-containing protein